jgi:hypothetical protein
MNKRILTTDLVADVGDTDGQALAEAERRSSSEPAALAGGSESQ